MRINKKKFIYLISPNKIYSSFYNDLEEVLKSRKVSFFQLRLKKISLKKKLLIGNRIKQICKKQRIKFLVNDDVLLAKKLSSDGCHLGQKDMKISNEEVAKLTLDCLKNSVPSDVPGIAFLSGGQSEIEATENLNLINKNNNTDFIMSYSYGRALQQSALKFWSKNIKDIEGTQNVFNHRAKMNTLAAQGKWSKDLENK